MGYMSHHAIVVTSWNEELLRAAHAAADSLGCQVSSFVLSPFNGYWSFMVAPDGSKEGWDGSNVGDARRELLIGWLRHRCHPDGSSPFNWAEVRYGDDNNEAALTGASDIDKHREGQ